jgi:fucose 4-O-acetylase-like acetyltransferase
MALAKRQISFSWIIAITGVVGSVAYRYVHYNIMQANRFPPDTQWLIGGIVFLMVWLSAARLLERVPVVNNVLAEIGKNTLFFYLFSNLLIFAGRKSFENFPIGMSLSLVLTVVLMGIIYFFITIIKPASPKKPALKPAQP